MQYFSLLDLSPIPEGGTAADALGNTIDLARHAEASGYHRYWLPATLYCAMHSA